MPLSIIPKITIMPKRLFDLNIEDVLDHWEAPHAIREIISNALDEQVLTRTQEIGIYEDGEGWHIRDFGRGLRIEHFTLNENEEKLSSSSEVIGKFGVGLKDALATFHRRGVGVLIRSRYGTYRLRQERKHNFDNIVTLHIEHDDAPTGITGTDVVLQGLHRRYVAEAKALFLKFSGEHLLESTGFGEVLNPGDRAPRVYISGVLANEEPNFLFSYNITSLTAAMRKKMSRERVNLGRTMYVERVKAILKSATRPAVQDRLADQVLLRSAGEQCDEMQWIEISQAALNLLHGRQRVAYVTNEEILEHPNLIDNMQGDGLQVVTITNHERTKLHTQAAVGGPAVSTLNAYVESYNKSFQYQFVEPANLLPAERRVFDLTTQVLSLVEPDRTRHPTVRVSETLRVSMDRTAGVWDGGLREIIIKRDQLRNVTDYAGTLLHEAAHAFSGAVDATREFELKLTEYLGRVVAAAFVTPKGLSGNVVETAPARAAASAGVDPRGADRPQEPSHGGAIVTPPTSSKRRIAAALEQVEPKSSKGQEADQVVTLKQTPGKKSYARRPKQVGEYTIGDIVEHPAFGCGRILDLGSQGLDIKVRVDFGPKGTKVVLSRLAKLRVSDVAKAAKP